MKKTIFIALTGIAFIVALVGLFFVYELYTKAGFSGEKEFVVAKGENLSDVSQRLLDKKFIKSKFVFEIYLRLKKEQGSIQAGTYILTPMNTMELADTLVLGKVDNEIELKFTEGQTLEDLAKILLDKKIITDKKDFLNLTKIDNFKNDYDFLKDIPDTSLEGFLFPDTYLIYKDATVEDVIKKMLNNFGNKLTPALQTEITAQGKTLYDVLKMASILEREVKTETDMKLAAGILWQRIATKMALQVDSSLKYIIGGNNPSLTLNELDIDSPYNTYKYLDLPPTPIGNPGIKAIRATIYPEKSDYWYYLSAKDSGETIFAKTYDEHKQNIKKYLK